MNLVADPIPNIRFNVAKALEVIAVTVSTDAEGQELAARKVVPALEKLAGDSDPDVRCESLVLTLYPLRTKLTRIIVSLPQSLLRAHCRRRPALSP